MARLKTSDLPDDASEIFLPEGLDTISENQPVGQTIWESAAVSGNSGSAARESTPSPARREPVIAARRQPTALFAPT
jgi:hypothetical protein